MRSTLIGIVSLLWALSGSARAQSDGSEDPLAELAALAALLETEAPQAGGSIRAQSTAQSAGVAPRARRSPKTSLTGKVTRVLRGKSPFVCGLVLRVTQPPTRGTYRASIKPSATIKVVPAMKRRGRSFDLSDPYTLLNAGCYYLRPGDTVQVQVKQQAKQLYRALYIERK